MDANNDSNVGRKKQSIFKEVSLENVGEAFDFKKTIQGTKHFLPLVIAIGLLFSLFFIYFSYQSLHTYSAESVLIFRQVEHGNEFQSLRLNQSSVLEIATLPTTLKAVQSILGLDLAPEDIRKLVTASIGSGNSNLIQLTVKSKNPILSVDIANTLANVVVRNSKQLSQKQLADAYQFYDNQLKEARARLQSETTQIAQFRQEHGISNADLTQGNIGLTPIEAQYETINQEYLRTLAEYESLAIQYENIPDIISVSALNVEGSSIRSRINQIQFALLDARSKYSPDNPKIKLLERQLDELYKMSNDPNIQGNQVSEPNPLKERLNLELMAMKAKLTATEKIRNDNAEKLKNAQKDIATHTQIQLNFNQMINEKAIIENEIKSFEGTLQTITMMRNLGINDIEVYTLAESANAPQGTQAIAIMLYPLLGFLLGSFLTLAGVTTSEFFDTRFRTGKQLELQYTPPCIAEIPEFDSLNKETANFQLLPYIRKLSERLKFIAGDFQVIAITSATEGEGKSTLAYHLATYYQQIGKSVCIIEGDYRHSPYLVKQEKEGLESYLMNQAKLSDILSTLTLPYIKTNHDPSMKELVKTPRINELINELKNKFDLVIIDSPGILEDEYSINLTQIADISIFVISSKKTKKGRVAACFKHFDDYNIVPKGLILNRIPNYYLDEHTGYEKEDKDKHSFFKFFTNLFSKR